MDFKYSVIAGASVSIFSSVLVTFELLSIKYKDLANKQILILVFTDLLISLTTFAYMYPGDHTICSITIYSALIIRACHKLMILFISYSMHSIIAKSTYPSYKFIKLYIIFGTIFAISQCILIRETVKIVIIDNYCSISKASAISTNLVIIINELIPNLTIFFCIVFMYWKVRNVLRVEAINCSINSATKRLFAKRLIGYGFAFSMFFSPYIIIEFLLSLNVFGSIKFAINIQLLFYSWYPFINSVVYGFTKSFKRNLLNLCIKSPDFDTQEDTLYLLRENNMIRPRFYLDLIEQSESYIRAS